MDSVFVAVVAAVVVAAISVLSGGLVHAGVYLALGLVVGFAAYEFLIAKKVPAAVASIFASLGVDLSKLPTGGVVLKDAESFAGEIESVLKRLLSKGESAGTKVLSAVEAPFVTVGADLAALGKSLSPAAAVSPAVVAAPAVAPTPAPAVVAAPAVVVTDAPAAVAAPAVTVEAPAPASSAASFAAKAG